LEVFIQSKNEKNEGRKETGGMGRKKSVGLDMYLYLAHKSMNIGSGLAEFGYSCQFGYQYLKNNGCLNSTTISNLGIGALFFFFCNYTMT
jgi:hypothetical protein